MTVDSENISRIDFLEKLKGSEKQFLIPYFFKKTLRRGEMAFMEGETADTLYTLIDGVMKLFKTSANGKEQIISLATPYEILNDTSIFDGGPNPVSAQAISPAILYGIKREKLEQIIQQHPEITLDIIKLLAERNRKLLTLIEDLSFKQVIGRVGKILLEHGNQAKDHPHRLTQQEMAAIAGTAREVVARSLKTLEERGYVKIDRNRISITNKPALEEMILTSS